MIQFLVYTIFGSLIWNSILTIMGVKLGSNWDAILDFFNEFSHIVLIILVILAIIFVSIFYYRRLHKNKKRR